MPNISFVHSGETALYKNPSIRFGKFGLETCRIISLQGLVLQMKAANLKEFSQHYIGSFLFRKLSIS